MADELSEKYGEKNMGSDERSNTYGFTAEHHRQVTGHGVEISHTGAWKCPTCKAKGKA